MLQFVCHPSIENLLTTSKEGMNCVTLTNNAVFISDFLPKALQPIHAGLLEATKYRLTYPSNYIYIASFFPKEYLLPFDTFGILQLTGTEFIHLPFQIDQFLLILEEKQETELNLSKDEWEAFAISTCKVLLKKKIGHGFGTLAILKISLDAQNHLHFGQNINVLMKSLSSVKSYREEEIAEIIELTNICKNLQDDYLQAVAEFVEGLYYLESLANEQEINVHSLISYIDTLNTIIKKIRET
jgi:hypothetical protein